jgi:poly(hydroxyalkanoate) depolymerase family esterase
MLIRLQHGLARLWRTARAWLARWHLWPSDNLSSAWQEGLYREPHTRRFFAKARHEALGYRLYLPTRSASETHLPLLVMLHGCSQTARVFAAGTRMNALAEERGFAVLYPEQSRQANVSLCWNWFEASGLDGAGEAALIARTVRHVLHEFPIDAARVAVAGLSAGGAMAALLAARHAELFAACAVHSGLMYRAAVGGSQALNAMRGGAVHAPRESARYLVEALGGAPRLVPTLVIHGSADTAVNALNGAQLVEQLCALAELAAPGRALLPSGEERRVASSGRAYLRRDYRRHGELLVRSIIIEGLGHAWSGGDDAHRHFDAGGPDASRLVADFVFRYRNAGGMGQPAPAIVAVA